MESITFTEFFGLTLKYLASTEDDPKGCWLNERANELHPKMLELSIKFSDSLLPLKTLHFIEAGAFAYSTELARSLDLLQQSGIIRRENPYYDQFRPTWHPDTREYLDNRLHKIFDVAEYKIFDEFVTELKSLRAEGVNA